MSLSTIKPTQLFGGVTLVLSPHMDDEALACGGSMASSPLKQSLHVIYATDGSRSPLPTGASPSSELVEVRTKEAREALMVLGVPDQNICFLGFPDNELKEYEAELTGCLAKFIRSISPDRIFIPFRYDRHPDHLALHRAARKAAALERSHAEIFEYCVYSRYRLLPGGDIRKFIRPELTINSDIREWAGVKQAALDAYRSQTTRYYSWQTRPILTPKRVAQVCQEPEVFIRTDPDYSGSSVFARGRTWIRWVHTVEPWLKDVKERILFLLRTGKVLHGRQAS